MQVIILYRYVVTSSKTPMPGGIPKLESTVETDNRRSQAWQEEHISTTLRDTSITNKTSWLMILLHQDAVLHHRWGDGRCAGSRTSVTARYSPFLTG